MVGEPGGAPAGGGVVQVSSNRARGSFGFASCTQRTTSTWVPSAFCTSAAPDSARVLTTELSSMSMPALISWLPAALRRCVTPRRPATRCSEFL